MPYNPYKRTSAMRRRGSGARSTDTAAVAAQANAAASAVNETVITDPRMCCSAPECITEELYAGTQTELLVTTCCDQLHGCREYDARRRCPYWPRFAHPRWLTCRELYDRRI